MIDVKHLRVGNIIKSKDGNLPYWAITEEDMITILQAEDRSIYEPIPITEEWLLKLGFEDFYEGDNDYIKYIDPNRDYYLQLDVRRRDGKYTILDNPFNDDLRDFSRVYIIYLHQLQNIYFALTGEELELNK